MDEKSDQLTSLFFQFEVLIRSLSTNGCKRASLNPHCGQGRVLQILKLKPDITQKELSDSLDMSKQALGELLNKLENCGYITKEASLHDRRVMLIHLTQEGLRACEKMKSEYHGKNDPFSCLSEEEKDVLITYFERLIEANKNEQVKMRKHHHCRKQDKDLKEDEKC